MSKLAVYDEKPAASHTFEAFMGWPGRPDHVKIVTQGRNLVAPLDSGNTTFTAGANGHNTAHIELITTLNTGEVATLKADVKVTKTDAPGTVATFGGYQYRATDANGSALMDSGGFVDMGPQHPVFVII